MKTSTYASLVTIAFFTHRNAISKSIESVIRTTDKLASDLGFHPKICHMTKYRIISELLQSNILTSRKTKKNIKLALSQKINKLL